MRDTIFIARTDFSRLLRQREVILWTFVMPLFFFYFMSAINRGPAPSADRKDRLGLLVPPDAGYLADQLAARLEQRNFAVHKVSTERELAPFSRRVRIPQGFTASVLAKRPVKIEFEPTFRGLGGDFDELRVQRASYQLLADFGLLTIAGKEVSAASIAEVASRPRLLTVESRTAGKRLDPPSGSEHAVPGTMVMFVLLVSFTTGAISLAIQRRAGTLRRLAFAPMARESIVAGKWAARWLLALLQTGYAMIVGSLAFDVRWGEHLGAILFLMACYTALAAGLGVLLGNFARTEKQVIGSGVVASNLLAALGGCWWPIEVTPQWAQTLALATPTGWAMDALHKLISFGMPVSSILPHAAAMLASALAAGWLIARRFRFE